MVRMWALSDSIRGAVEKASRDGRANKCNTLPLQRGSLESTNVIEPLYPFICSCAEIQSVEVPPGEAAGRWGSLS